MRKVALSFSLVVLLSASVASAQTWQKPTSQFSPNALSPVLPLDSGSLNQSKSAGLKLNGLNFSGAPGVPIGLTAEEGIGNSFGYFIPQKNNNTSYLYNGTEAFVIDSKGLVLPNVATSSVTAVSGAITFDKVSAKVYLYNGTDWVPIGSGVGSVSATTTPANELWVLSGNDLNTTSSVKNIHLGDANGETFMPGGATLDKGLLIRSEGLSLNSDATNKNGINLNTNRLYTLSGPDDPYYFIQAEAWNTGLNFQQFEGGFNFKTGNYNTVASISTNGFASFSSGGVFGTPSGGAVGLSLRANDAGASQGHAWTSYIDNAAGTLLGNPSGYEIWEYGGKNDPCTSGGICTPRLKIKSGGETILAPSGGNVGVGIDNPTERLQVSGNLTVKGKAGFSYTLSQMLPSTWTETVPGFGSAPRLAKDTGTEVGTRACEDDYQTSFSSDVDLGPYRTDWSRSAGSDCAVASNRLTRVYVKTSEGVANGIGVFENNVTIGSSANPTTHVPSLSIVPATGGSFKIENNGGALNFINGSNAKVFSLTQGGSISFPGSIDVGAVITGTKFIDSDNPLYGVDPTGISKLNSVSANGIDLLSNGGSITAYKQKLMNTRNTLASSPETVQVASFTDTYSQDTPSGGTWGSWRNVALDANKPVFGISIQGSSDDGGMCEAGVDGYFYGFITRSAQFSSIDTNGTLGAGSSCNSGGSGSMTSKSWVFEDISAASSTAGGGDGCSNNYGFKRALGLSSIPPGNTLSMRTFNRNTGGPASVSCTINVLYGNSY